MNYSMQLQQHKKQLIILMTLLFFVSQACTDIYVPGLPQMTRQFNTNIDKMTMTITMYTYGQAFFFLFIGVASDLLGRRKVLIPAIFIQIIASFLIAISNSISLMIILRLFQAVGSGAIYIVLRLIIKDVMSREEQVQAVGIFVTALPLSLALAPVIGAWTIYLWNWQACFVLVGVIQGILLIWAFILIQETHLSSSAFRNEFKLVTYFTSYFYILKNRLFLNLSLIVCGVFASYYSFISISSYMFIDEYHVSSTLYSYIFIAIAGFYLLGNQIMLRLHRNSATTLILIKIGVVIAVIGIVFMLIGLFFHTLGWLILGLITCGVVLLRMATAFINPPIQVIVTHYYGKNGAQAIGLLSSLQYAAAGVGTTVVSILPWHPSLNLVMSSLLFCLVSLAGLYFCPRQEL